MKFLVVKSIQQFRKFPGQVVAVKLEHGEFLCRSTFPRASPFSYFLHRCFLLQLYPAWLGSIQEAVSFS